MQGVNKAIIVGTLGSDPEVRYSQSGTAIANISVATNNSYKDKNGELKKETEWHRVVMFARLAEVAEQYLGKGDKVYVEGRIKTNKWQDKEGNDRYTTEIVANSLQMLGGNSQTRESQPASGYKPAEPAYSDFDDEIPFS